MTNERGPTVARPEVLRVLQTKEEIRAFYNKIARVYDLLAERSEQPMRAAGLEKLHPRQGESLLEVGFGTGHMLAGLARAHRGRGPLKGGEAGIRDPYFRVDPPPLLEPDGLPADLCAAFVGIGWVRD